MVKAFLDRNTATEAAYGRRKNHWSILGEERGRDCRDRLKIWQTVISHEQLTKEQVDAGGEWDYARCRYVMTTKDGTYLLYYASDLQFTQETMEEYRQMQSEISDIRFVADHAFN